MKKNYVVITPNCIKKSTKRGRVVFRKFFIDSKENKHYVDGKYVRHDIKNNELEVAKWLAKTYGDTVFINPVVNYPDNIKTADFLWNGMLWDLKTIDKKSFSKNRIVDNVIKRSKNQSSNIILDVTKADVKITEIIKQVEMIFSAYKRNWINIVMIIQNYKVVKILKRK